MFSLDDLKNPTNQNLFFELVEYFMLDTYPNRVLRYRATPPPFQKLQHLRAPFYQLAPIMNTIDDILTFLLQELAKLTSYDESVMRDYQNTFTRAATIYSRIMVELGLSRPLEAGISENNCSYLDALVEFLR